MKQKMDGLTWITVCGAAIAAVVTIAAAITQFKEKKDAEEETKQAKLSLANLQLTLDSERTESLRRDDNSQNLIRDAQNLIQTMNADLKAAGQQINDLQTKRSYALFGDGSLPKIRARATVQSIALDIENDGNYPIRSVQLRTSYRNGNMDGMPESAYRLHMENRLLIKVFGDLPVGDYETYDIPDASYSDTYTEHYFYVTLSCYSGWVKYELIVHKEAGTYLNVKEFKEIARKITPLN